MKTLRSLAVIGLLAAPAAAQAPQGPDKMMLELNPQNLALIVKAIGNGLVKNEADPLLQNIQGQLNAQMVQWQKDHTPPETVPLPTPAPEPKQ